MLRQIIGSFLCFFGSHKDAEKPDVFHRSACVDELTTRCVRCGEIVHSYRVTKPSHHYEDGRCPICGQKEPVYTPSRHSGRLTSEIERDPDADEHEWLGSDINLRR